jgi:hypothetical protein
VILRRCDAALTVICRDSSTASASNNTVNPLSGRAQGTSTVFTPHSGLCVATGRKYAFQTGKNQDAAILSFVCHMPSEVFYIHCRKTRLHAEKTE